MKKIFLSIGLILIIVLSVSILILSTTGFETDKFNKIIASKIEERSKNIFLKLEKVKFKIDIKEVSLFNCDLPKAH